MAFYSNSKLNIYNVRVSDVNPIIMTCGPYTFITLKGIAIRITEFVNFFNKVFSYAVVYLTCVC